MKEYKEFLVQICDIENVSAKDIAEITGKSRSVVYGWLDYSKNDCFPSIESLGKILFRLGISFDDFINFRHPIYDTGNSARVYYRYKYGFLDKSYIGSDLLELPNVDKVLKTYLIDRSVLNKMISDYIDGVEIDKERFNFLCKALEPFVDSECFDSVVYHLESGTLPDYKMGIDVIKEIKEEYEMDENIDVPFHKLFYPDINYVMLLAAERDIKLLNKYLSVADSRDVCLLLQYYLNIRSDNPKYDKKNRINKMLVENKYVFFDVEDKKAEEEYRELLEKVVIT